jgi:hypothetical protein
VDRLQLYFRVEIVVYWIVENSCLFVSFHYYAVHTSVIFNIRLPNRLRREYIRNFEFLNYLGYVHTLEKYFRFSLRLLMGGRKNGTHSSLNMGTKRSQYFRNVNEIKLWHFTFFSNTSISQLTTTLTFLSCNYVIPVTNISFKKKHKHPYRYCVYLICILYIFHI